MTDMAEVLESGLAEARERERIAARAAQADALELRNAAMDAGLPVHEHLVELWLNAYDGRPTPDDGPQVDRAAAAQWAPAPRRYVAPSAPTRHLRGQEPDAASSRRSARLPRDRRPAGRRGQPAAPWWPSSPRPQQGARIGLLRHRPSASTARFHRRAARGRRAAEHQRQQRARAEDGAGVRPRRHGGPPRPGHPSASPWGAGLTWAPPSGPSPSSCATRRPTQG